MRRGDLSLSHSQDNFTRSDTKPTSATHELQLKINNIELKKQVVNIDIQRIL